MLGVSTPGRAQQAESEHALPTIQLPNQTAGITSALLASSTPSSPLQIAQAACE